MRVDTIAWKYVSCTPAGRSRTAIGMPGVTNTSHFKGSELIAKRYGTRASASRTKKPRIWPPRSMHFGLVEALPEIDIIDRATVNAFDDERVARAIEATGRKKLIFAGISLEICAAFPAITAVGKGLDAYIAVDACGTFSPTKREVGLLRMLQAGVITSDYASLMVEILKDNARPDAGAIYGVIDMPWAELVGQMAQAYAK